MNTVVPWRPAATNSGCPLGARVEVSSAEKTHGREDTLAWTTPWMDDTLGLLEEALQLGREIGYLIRE